MAGKVIFLFMWSYQHSYRFGLEYLAEQVIKTLGINIKPKVLVVGARRPKSNNRNPVCVEPEDGEWSVNLFSGLLDSIETIYKSHPNQNLIYSNSEIAMREKPELMHRDSVRAAVKQSLREYDTQQQVHSFCGMAYPVEDYYVVPVVQVPEFVFGLYPPLRNEIGDRTFSAHPSFIHAAMSVLLGEATAELAQPNPGYGGPSIGSRTAKEIVRQAASIFLRTPVLALKNQGYHFDLFEQFNSISSLMYEGTKGTGRLLLVHPENPAIDYDLRLVDPVPFREHRWARKILQMASDDIMLVADCEKIHGLGKLKANCDSSQQDAFIIDFLDHYYWQLRSGNQVLLQCRYGEPKLPQEPVSQDRFIDNYSRLFPQTSSAQQNHIWRIFNIAIQQNHGCMILVATDAIDEVQRLAQQGTVIKPTLLTEELFYRVSGIDGTIIISPDGICHAIGVILDGPANEDCTPSRGSRFNSGIRYVKASHARRLAIVISDDHTVDIIPMLRPRINRNEIIQVIESLELATTDNYHKSQNWLDEHRFYLDADMCERANNALQRIKSIPNELYEIRYITNHFEPHAEMDESYFLPTY
ncbi:diadenylate cyclase [Methylomonas methanica]|uniref:DAC domain-containing protein n=1 Tax=Methylomonas methanica TaxID=421 RepID=A0A177MRR1_METMH|nr:diadenylate cyclase [Methylomonas methanica]OAI07570.1 hypothetical protein A1332_08790 [Methylomonas methanica]